MPEMPAPKTPPVCDTCGQPATMGVRDALRHELPGETYARFTVTGATRWGCEAHPVRSIEMLTSLP